ncbi:squalene epoxidase, FAD/NAD(P)-binding domain protein [Artemisia annua]|uniref:Squalene monooxygenase n=1 Tax=Artemisia annua TaxID=35608 RepID=A0A2U1NLU1_ARTAN|nr:squalene epoxidase, FAD/NAD(P)-binding domain protein [Artemisia annua]
MPTNFDPYEPRYTQQKRRERVSEPLPVRDDTDDDEDFDHVDMMVETRIVGGTTEWIRNGNRQLDMFANGEKTPKQNVGQKHEDGIQILVVERDLRLQDRVVGELLQLGGYMKLIDLGLEDCAENIDAQKVFGYALFKDGKSTRLLTYWRNLKELFQVGVFTMGNSVNECVRRLQHVRLEQGTVTSLVEEKRAFKGVRYKTKGGQDTIANAPLTIVCDGCFSNLRRGLCKPEEDFSVDMGTILVDWLLEVAKEYKLLPYCLTCLNQVFQDDYEMPHLWWSWCSMDTVEERKHTFSFNILICVLEVLEVRQAKVLIMCRGLWKLRLGSFEALAKAWIKISVDRLVGDRQIREGFWKRVLKHFKTLVPRTQRTKDQLNSKWTPMHAAIAAFNGYYTQATQESTGSSKKRKSSESSSAQTPTNETPINVEDFDCDLPNLNENPTPSRQSRGKKRRILKIQAEAQLEVQKKKDAEYFKFIDGEVYNRDMKFVMEPHDNIPDPAFKEFVTNRKREICAQHSWPCSL